MMLIKPTTVGLLQTESYLCWNPKTHEGFLVDPGYSADKLLKVIAETGVTLKAILLTHGHFDHILAVEEMRNATGAQVIAGVFEEALLADPQMNLSHMGAHKLTVVRADRLVEDGEVLSLCGFDVQVISTPGHTRGSVCYYIENEKVLIAGDTLFFHSYGNTSYPTGSEIDMRLSIDRLLTTLPGDTSVCPGHGETTTIEEERRHNPLWLEMHTKGDNQDDEAGIEFGFI